MKKVNRFKKCFFIIKYIKWIVMLFVLFSFVLNNFIFKKTSIFNYFINFITSITIIFLLIQSTKKGKKIFLLIKEAKTEFNKIIFPKKKETFYMTLVIVLVTFLTSILVWGLDNILFYIISTITKLRI
ncbi:preprotein translocase subunit SecE [Buchnera aphidicola (Mindarus keteleerifoliae)]|uniref:preprotein translocase subunit SecE n=1 Tax=Buchnera aphidicola TaxID=9 RepID=UPI0031B692C5